MVGGSRNGRRVRGMELVYKKIGTATHPISKHYPQLKIRLAR